MLENLTLISFLSSFFILTIVSIYSYILYKKENKIEEIELEAYKNSKDVLFKANKKAEFIIDKAAGKAQEILTQTEYFKEYLEEDVKKTIQESMVQYKQILEKNSHAITQNYLALFSQLKEEFLQETKTSLAQIEEAGQKTIADFSKLFQQALASSQTSLKTQISSEFENAKKEIDLNKQQEYKKISDRINKTVEDLSKELLNRIISIEDHEKLVLDALEKAKLEGVLNG